MTGDWQGRAYAYYDELGEIHYAANFHARIGKLRFYIGRVDANDEIEEQPDSDLLAQLGDVNAIAETYGRQRFLGGESYAIEYLPHDATTSDEVVWECLSPLECKRTDDRVELLGRPKVNGMDVTYARVANDEPLAAAGEAHLFRLWRGHPKNAYETDATMRAVLQDCERLRLVRAKDISETRSRIPAGMFVYPKRAFPPGPDDAPGQPPKSLRDLQESLVRPIRDLSDPSAQVPTMIGVDGTSQDAPQDVFRHFTFERRGDQAGDATKEERCVIAIARGLDMPVEYLTGVGAVNHWGQWFIEDQLWKSHLQPLAAEFCREWTDIYLTGITDDESLVIWYDETDIVAQPDRGKDAKDLFPLGAMTWDELRDSNGFKPDAGPSDEERAAIAEWLGSTRQQSAPPGAGQDSGSTDQTPPATANGASANSVEGLAAYRAREVAGNRLINLARKADPELLAVLAECPRHLVACRVGRQRAYELTGSTTPELALLEGAGATYAAYLAEQGISESRIGLYVSSLLHGVAADLFDAHTG